MKKDNKLPFSQCQSLKQLKQLHMTKKVDQFVRLLEKIDFSNIKLNANTVTILENYKRMSDEIELHFKQSEDFPKDWVVNRTNPSSITGIKFMGNLIQMKFIGVINVTLSQVWHLCMDVNSYYKWMPFCITSKVVKVQNSLEQLAYLKYKLPLLNERFVYINVTGVDRIEHNGTIIIYCEGASEEYNHGEKCSPLLLRLFIVQLTPMKSSTGKGKVKIKTYGEVTSRLGLLPNWLINLVMKEISSSLIKRMGQFASRIPQGKSTIPFSLPSYLPKL